MLYVHTLHDFRKPSKAFREGQLKSFLHQSLEFLAPDFSDGTRCADGRQQMRSFDEARFGSNSEVAVFSRHLRLIPNADSARTLDELNDPGVSGLTSAYHFRSTPMNGRRCRRHVSEVPTTNSRTAARRFRFWLRFSGDGRRQLVMIGLQALQSEG
jgi:hypothetical protein